MKYYNIGVDSGRLWDERCTPGGGMESCEVSLADGARGQKQRILAVSWLKLIGKIMTVEVLEMRSNLPSLKISSLGQKGSQPDEVTMLFDCPSQGEFGVHADDLEVEESLSDMFQRRWSRQQEGRSVPVLERHFLLLAAKRKET